MEAVFDRIVEISWQASVLAILVILVQWTIGRKLPPAWRCGLWMLVYARLAMPVLPASGVSVFNLFEPRPAAAANYRGVVVTVPGVPAPVLREMDRRPDVAWPIPPTPSGRSGRLTARQVLAAAWLLGALLVLTRGLWATTRFGRDVRRGGRRPNASLVALLEDCARPLQLRKPPELIETGRLSAPALYGVFRPTVILPIGLAQRLSAEQMRFVLLHELEHLRRRDILTGWIVWLLGAIHWFNPLVWVLARWFRADRELACDRRVLERFSGRPWREYGQAILALLTDQPASRRIAGAAAMVESGSSLRRRLASLAHPVRSRWPWLALAGVIAGGLVALTFTTSKPPAAPLAQFVLHVFDARDLLDPQSTSEWVIGADGKSATQPVPPRFSHDQMADALLDEIKADIDPTSWSDHGGRGKISELMGQLIITQTEPNQEMIARWLDAKVKKLYPITTVQIALDSLDADPTVALGPGRWLPIADGVARWSGSLDYSRDKNLVSDWNPRGPMSGMRSAVTYLNDQAIVFVADPMGQAGFIQRFRLSATRVDRATVKFGGRCELYLPGAGSTTSLSPAPPADVRTFAFTTSREQTFLLRILPISAGSRGSADRPVGNYLLIKSNPIYAQ